MPLWKKGSKVFQKLDEHLTVQCQLQYASCSSCCGVHNLNLTAQQKAKLLKRNTKIFKAVQAENPKNIAAYRAKREKVLEFFKIKNDIYVCPFVGFLETDRTGCMIHPLAEINPAMKKWEHPQNFGFYGEGICLVYDCPSKENNYKLDFINHLNFIEYSVIAGHAQALEILNLLNQKKPGSIKREFVKIYAQWMLRNKIPVTSFETKVDIHSNQKLDYLISVLSLFLDKDFYESYLVQFNRSTVKRANKLNKLIFG